MGGSVRVVTHFSFRKLTIVYIFALNISFSASFVMQYYLLNKQTTFSGHGHVNIS